MEEVSLGSGGFEFPRIYKENKNKIKRLIANEGRQDLVELSHWSAADAFMQYVLESKFLEFADKTYPSPRSKPEVPVWFIISAQIVLRIFSGTRYSDLDTFLKSGSLLSRVGYNVARAKGFNDKNTYEREVPCHQDTVRKFFKDTEPDVIRDWFSSDVQQWFLKNNGFDSEGVFILDQSHLVVPNNEHYKDAKLMPVDEHGQLYKGTKEEIKNYRWHLCYTLSTLLHLKSDLRSFHYAGYEFGPGNEDELPHAEQILDRYVKTCGKGIIKLLIVDRGYISGDFINTCKGKLGADVLMPLRTNMTQYQDAIAISKMPETKWLNLSDPEQQNFRDQGTEFKIVFGCTISDIKLWDTCKYPLYVTVIKEEIGTNFETVETNYFILVSTRCFASPFHVQQSYKLRTRVEEGFRQLKHVWSIARFTSPDESLLETQVAFVLLAYSLLNLYLRHSKQFDMVSRFVTNLQKEAQSHSDDKTIVAYADDVFGLFSIKEYLEIICTLKEEQRQSFLNSLGAVNQR